MAAVFCFFVFFTTVFAVNTLGCQFYPAGEYLRFVRVPESLPVGEEVLQVEVYPRRNLTIQSVDKADDVKFFRYDAINRTVVSIRLAESLEDLVDSAVPRNVLKFRLICDYDDGDDTITSYLSITVYVEDVNDHSPVFQGTPYIVTVDELTPTGLTIFRGIHATDNDKPNTPNSDVQYTIIGGNEKGKFALENSPRASLILRRPLDYDSGDNKFLLTIVASDRGNDPRNATTSVQIAVTDSDDLSPRFTRDVYKTQVTEFYPITGKRIHQELHFDPRIEAYDQDRMINASIQYDVIAGNERHLFAIDQNNGTLFLERELDLDSLPGNTFTLQIQASQLDNPLKTGVARVEVELLDINDNLPQFEVDLYNISIVENLPNGFSVLQVIATDQDQGDNGEFVYHLMDPSQAFSIDGRSGWLTVRNQAKLDREQRPSLSMRVLAREKLPSVVTPPSDAYVAVEVTLLDANDNNPMFIPSNLYEFTAPIDINVGQVVGRVEAIDPDLGRNGMVLYEMKRSNNITTSNRGPQMFTVDAQTGRITVMEPPSGPGKHTLFVEASDQPANPSERRFSLAVVSIHVVETGKTEVIPDFVGAPYEFWVGSDVPIGTSVGQIRVSEAVDGKTIIYDLLHSYNEGVPFAVEERLGTITVVDDMDKYDRTLYDFEAVVTDEMTLTLITNVTIHVVQSDSIFQSSNLAKDLELRVRENQSGAFIGQLITTAGNVTLPSSYWKTMKFVIANEPDVLQQFAISPDGTLYTQRGLDRERKDSYQLTIIAENSRALRALFRVHVIVEDENDNPPMFERPWYVGHIREDCTPGCKVAMETGIKVHDADDGVNSEFTLTLRGNDSQLFHLNASTGSVVLNGLLDRESKHEYSFKVVATDRGNLSSETSLTIYVDDVNDNIPRFVHLMVHSGDMVELDNSTDSPIQVVVGKNSTIIKPETSLDDQILSTVPTIKVSETVMVGFVVVRVMAEDKDSGENATISYRLDSEAYLPQFEASSSMFTTHHFTLHPITGDISVAAVLPPETMFQLNISATDGGGLSQHILLKIFVKDVNNNPPMFEKSRYFFEIEEGDYTGRGVGQLIATDPDFGDNANISYSLLLKRNNSSIQFPFSITDTGVLSVDSILDREKQSVYNFRVMAQDRGPVNRRLRSTVDVEIHVLDVNDNAPVFYGHDRVVQTLAVDLGDPSIKQSSDFEPTVFVPVYTASVQENNAPGITVGRVFANDSDSLANGNGMILYRIQHRSSQPHLFAIDSKDGTVSTTMSLDYEVQSQHNVTVVASDLGHPSLSSTALLIVNVVDVSEQHQETSSPVFTHRYYELEVEENSAVPLQLLTVSVSEEYRQKAKNSLHFSVAPGVDSSLFDVAQHNGTVMLVSSPDREVQDKLQVVIRVQPAKQPRGFIQVIHPVQTSDLAPNEARVVVRVKDANDNSPHFSLNGRPLVAAIPTTANYGYPIARLQATDADTGLNAEIRYQILGGEAGYFSVDPYSGHIRAVASFTHYAGRVFGFDVKATDRAGAHDGRSAIANVFVYVLHEHKKLALVMAAKPIDVEANIDNIIRALSNVTALDVRLRMLEPHQEDGKFTDNTDMYVYAVDPVMNVIVDSDSLRDVLTAKESEVKRILEPLHLMGVVGSGFPASPPLRTTPHNRTPLLTGLEVATIALGCVVFLGALTAAICVTCAHKKRNRFRTMGRSASFFRKKLEVGFPISNIDIALAAKSRMDCKPRSLFHPSAFIEDSTDSYASNRSDCNRQHRRTSHRHGPLCNRHHSRRLPARSPSTTMLEMSLASLHSSARDSGIGDPSRIRTRCPCGHSTSHSSANSSNGSYEDSLKSLHRHHSHSSGGSGGVGAGGSGGAATGNGICNHDFATISRHRRQESSGTALMQPPPPPFSTPALARRPSERIIIPR